VAPAGRVTVRVIVRGAKLAGRACAGIETRFCDRAEVAPPAFARPGRFKRCTLPITALRLTPPSCAAIWLALNPSDQSFLSRSTRSSVQFTPLSIMSSF
jgi:hypothetical protein